MGVRVAENGKVITVGTGSQPTPAPPASSSGIRVAPAPVVIPKRKAPIHVRDAPVPQDPASDPASIYDPVDAIVHPPNALLDLTLNPPDPERTYVGPGSGVIPSATDDELTQKDVGRDYGAINPETGEYDKEAADPMEKVLPARIDQKMRDKATGLLKDQSLRDVFSHGDQTTWVEQRQQQLLNNKFSETPAATEEERQKQNDAAYWSAVDELATLATVGYTGGPIPLPLNKRPDSSLWGNLTGKKVELLGKDKNGNLVLRSQNDLGWAVDVLSIPQYAFASTGIPERAIQAAFGKKEGAPDPNDPGYASDVLSERRTFSDMARDADPQSFAAKAVLYPTAFAGDVLFPDLLMVGGKVLKVPAKIAEVAMATEKGAKALEATRTARALVGLTGKADAVAHVDDLVRAEEEAGRAAAATTDLSDRVGKYAEGVASVQEKAKKFSEPLAKEIDRRALAATSEAAAKGGDDVLRAMEHAAVDETGSAVRGTEGLLKGLARVARTAATPAEHQAAESLLSAVKAGRQRAIASVQAGLTAPAKTVAAAEGSLSMVTDAMGLAPRESGVLPMLARAIGMKPNAAGMRAVEQAARAGTLVLEAEDVAGLAQRIEQQVGKEGMANPALMQAMPTAGQRVSVEQMAKLDEAVGKARRTYREAPDVAESTYATVKQGIVPQFARSVADTMLLPLRGADESKPFLQKGLGQSVRQATIRVQRGIDGVLSDVAKLKNEEQAIQYLAGASVRSRTGAQLITSGQSHAALFTMATNLRMAGASAIRDASQAFVRTDHLAELRKSDSTALDDLATWMLEKLVTPGDWGGEEAVASLVQGLRTKTAELLGEEAVAVEGWRRLSAVTAAHGQQVAAAEELLGSGVVLTDADRMALLDTMGASGGMGHVPSAMDRAATEGGIKALEAAELAQERARAAYANATDLFGQLHALQEQGYAADAVREAKAKLQGSVRRTTTLGAAERASSLSQRIAPPHPANDLVRYAAHPGPVQVKLIDPATAERMRGLRQLMGSKSYVPQLVREQIAESIAKASSRVPPASRPLLSLYKQGVTRGIWMVSPRYNLFNFFGDAEQTFLAHGVATSAKSTIRSAMQQALSLPLVGQGLALAGKSEAARNAASALGDIAVSPGKVLPVLKAMKQTGSLRAAMEAASSLSEVNRIMEGSDDVFRLGDRLVSGKKLREAAVKGGVFDSQPFAMAADEVGSSVKVLDEAAKLWQLPGKASDAVRDSVQDVVEGIGERQRVGLYVSLIERGADPEEAAEGVVRALYDYKYSIAESERGVAMRWLLPWWAWQKNAYRQMTETVLSPMGSYKIKAMLAAPESATEWASWYGEGRDVDPLGVRTGVLNQGETEGYHRLVEYMSKQGLSPAQMRAALYEVAPLGSADGGIESWPGITPELVDDYMNVARAIVPPQGSADVRSYEQGRPMIRVRPSDGDVKKLWDSPNASTADYYAYLLPPSMAESYFNWAGAYAGIISTVASAGMQAAETGHVPGGMNIFTLAASQIDPMRSPLVGLALSTIAGKKVVVPVSGLVGQGLAAIDAADVLPSKNRGGKTLTTEQASDVAARGKSQTKYAITNPMLAVAWQSMGSSLSNLDSWAQNIEAVQRDPSWRTTLKLGFGLPSADIEPAGTPVSESYQVGDGMSVVPIAKQPIGAAPAARPPSTDESYSGE
jgi:hypothetical protein